jgi:PucR family transcriptional regulator, purine catabolism regulatory protein
VVSLADLLLLEELALTPVHLPTPEATVRWVATSELIDPAPFLEGSELLLTTGLSMRGWRSEWDDYVARLVAAGVVGLGFGAGLTHRRTPSTLVRACERHGLNLLEVPERTAFVAVSRATARLLEEAEQQAAREALSMQQELTAAAITTRDGAALPGLLASLVGGGSSLLAPDGNVLSGPAGPHGAEIDLQAVRDELARIRPHGLRAASSLSSPTGTTLLHPVGVRRRPTAYLAVLLPGRPTEAARSAVRTTVSLLGLASESGEERRESDRALGARAVELLLRGDARGAGLVLGAMSTPITLSRQVTVLRATPARPETWVALEDTRERCEDAGLLITLTDGELTAIVSPSREADLSTSLAAAGLLVGIGDRVTHDRIDHGHKTAGHALAHAVPGTPVVSWSRVLRGGVLGLLDPDQATSFADGLLAPLVPELRLTLLVFLKHHGSRLKTAEELGVHRNTVRHRLAQVEALTGLVLDDPADRVSAWVALHALPDRPGPHPPSRREA